MASTYVNNLRLNEMATGDGSGTWGTTTNTNLELIADAFGYGTEAIALNADSHATTIADGAADEGRAFYLKYTGTLDSACTITIGPNTIKKVWIVENATSGSQNIIMKQGIGGTVTIANGKVAVIYGDGAGSGAAMTDALTDLALSGTLTVAGAVTMSGDASVGDDLTLVSDAAVLNFGENSDVSLTHVHDTGLLLNSTRQLQFGDSGSYIQQSGDGVLRINGEGTVDIYGSSMVALSNDVRLNSDASVLGFGVNNDVTLTHVHDTGLLLNGAMALQFSDASQYINAPSATVLDITATDEIELNATAVDLNGTLDVSGTALVTGVLTTTATQVANGGITSGDDISVGATDKIFLDGGGNSYIHENSADSVQVVTGGSYRLGITDAGIYVAPTSKVFLDGGSNTYINESAADTISIVAGGTLSVSVTANGAGFNDLNITNVGDISLDSVSSDGSTAPHFLGTGSAGASEIGNAVDNAGLFIRSKTGTGAGMAIGTTSGGDAYLQGCFNDNSGGKTIILNPYGDNVQVTGALSKGSGSFLIPHPLPSMNDTHNLVHSFVEGPRADLIYRGSVALSSGSASIDLDAEVGMTDGTWELLCRDPQVFLQNESGWSALKGSVSGSTLIITCKDTTSFDTVSWLVVAERQDEHMMETSWTDDNGRPILEPLKPEDVEDGS